MNRNLTHQEEQRRRKIIDDELTEMNFRSLLANDISESMGKNNWSGRALASVIGINEITIRRILKGKQNCSIDILLKLCLALDIKLSDIAIQAGV